MKRQEKDGHLQTEERGLGHIHLSQPSEGTNTAHTLSLDFWPPQLGDNQLPLFKPRSLWSFVMAALANQYRGNDTILLELWRVKMF